MLRHSAFFMFREDTTLEQAVQMLKGLAYMRFACPSVRALDFGLDEFGGSSLLREVKPWKRQPRWRSSELGPAVSYDVALHLDFDDQAGMDDYNDDDVHHEVAVYNASICRGEETARVDWWYDGQPLITKNQVKHSAMFLSPDGPERSIARPTRHQQRAQVTPEVQRRGHRQEHRNPHHRLRWHRRHSCTDRTAAQNLLAGELYARP